eukprot:TRINITY_DN1044_c0_g3_i1.p1 TRINITY_DN1044_c0_g3~~TRINITY_DN1044_c0_g3_i1.p1  ORF type:complete len:446 (+),score=84.65 TRINITY_DN1044_c0_g3_i1:340-1677(+)
MLGFSLPGGVYDLDKKKKKQQQSSQETPAFPGVRLNVLPTDKEWGTRANCSIFGISLRKNSATIPPFLYKTVKWLEKHALTTEGIFRVTASNTEVDGLIALLEKGMDMKQINLDVYRLNPHVVSTTLKRYFRELPEPLLTFDYYYAFIEMRKTHIMEDLIELLHKLDIGNLVVLKFFMRYLFRVQEYADVNKMKADNLAIIFAPSLLRAPLELEPEIVLKNCGMANVIVSTMIFHYHYIFEERLRNRFMAAGLDPEIVSTSWTTVRKPGDKIIKLTTPSPSSSPSTSRSPPQSSWTAGRRIAPQQTANNWSCVPSVFKSTASDPAIEVPPRASASKTAKHAWIKSTSTPASVMMKQLEQLRMEDQMQPDPSALSPRSNTSGVLPSSINTTDLSTRRSSNTQSPISSPSSYTPSPPVIEFTVLPRNEMIFCSSFISEGDFIELPYL